MQFAKHVEYLATQGVRNVLIVTPGKTIQDKTMALIPVGDRVVFPGAEATLELSAVGVAELLDAAVREKEVRFGLRMQDNDNVIIEAELVKEAGG